MSVPVNAYTQGTGTSSIPGAVPLASAPGPTTLNYNPGQIVVVPSTNTAYILTSKTTSNGVVTANWTTISTAAGDIDSITTDDSTVVLPVSGNVNLAGAGSVTTIGAGDTATVELTGLTNHNVLVGAGTTTITKVAPSATSGIALVSAGAAADPHYSTVVVAGGGTGAVTLTGLLTGNGTAAVDATAITQYNVLTGGTTNHPNNVAPSVTSGVPLISQGAAAQPIFGTVEVAGGGTGAVTLTGVLTGNGTSAVTANAVTQHGVLLGGAANAVSSLGVATTGQVLIGASGADPAFDSIGVNSGLTGLVLGNNNTAFTTVTYTAAASFTPAFSLATAGDSAWTYSSQLGRYTQIGSMVFFNAQLVWTNFTNTTGSGTWRLNLPVTAGAFASAGQVIISGSGVDASAETANLPANFTGVIGTGATVVVLSVEEGGVGNAANALFNLTVSQVKTAGTMNVTGWYFAS